MSNKEILSNEKNLMICRTASKLHKPQNDAFNNVGIFYTTKWLIQCNKKRSIEYHLVDITAWFLLVIQHNNNNPSTCFMEVRIMRKSNFIFIAGLLATFWLTSASAVEVSVDSFAVSGTNSSGAFSFTDHFNDDAPPPCGPSGCASQPNFYAVHTSVPPLTESRGFLQLDSSTGILSNNASGGPRIAENVLVSGDKSLLLQSGGAISMAGIFTLPTISGPLNEGYGIRFIDAPLGSGFGGNEWVLELNVQW